MFECLLDFGFVTVAIAVSWLVCCHCSVTASNYCSVIVDCCLFTPTLLQSLFVTVAVVTAAVAVVVVVVVVAVAGAVVNTVTAAVVTV